MTIQSLLAELNESQRAAAGMPREHALVLAGAGCGKTKTVVARAAWLISNTTPADRIQILTFTRRAATEIVERVRLHLGDAATGLRASTFHTWCLSLIRRSPALFGNRSFSVIDRDDQVQLFKLFRGKATADRFPTAAELCDFYSFARNTGQTLEATLKKKAAERVNQLDAIGKVMLAYEKRKRDRKYFDYDDILDVVAQRMSASREACGWVGSLYDYVLVDEVQDTNPLQWKLLTPLQHDVSLFCVGDDAQSIYGFRGADFWSVHSFSDRVSPSVTLKLEQNYRSTQEILDVSNWLISQSPLDYDKTLVGVRGFGHLPQLHTFANDWEEARWIAEDLLVRRQAGALWRHHMILVRSSYAGGKIQAAMLAKEIPYLFIGGTKLLESAHIRDVLSVLRIVANPQDELGWMRFLELWPGVGDATAGRLAEDLLELESLDDCIQRLLRDKKVPEAAAEVLSTVRNLQLDVAKAFATAVQRLDGVLSNAYKKDWDRRQRDFPLVGKLAAGHGAISEFLEQYVLDPVWGTSENRHETDDVVTLITIHSAKGTEREVCYAANVSPGAYPSSWAAGNPDEVEEERRVLYVALTRAKDELIVTRQGYKLWAAEDKKQPDNSDEAPETYFFNDLPEYLFKHHVHQPEKPVFTRPTGQVYEPPVVGIVISSASQVTTIPASSISPQPLMLTRPPEFLAVSSPDIPQPQISSSFLSVQKQVLVQNSTQPEPSFSREPFAVEPYWINAVTSCSLLDRRLKSAGRRIPPKHFIGSILSTLAAHRGAIHRAVLCDSLGLPVIRFAGVISKMMQLLNVDNVPVLSYDDRDHLLRLNVELLCRQFQIHEEPDTEPNQSSDHY